MHHACEPSVRPSTDKVTLLPPSIADTIGVTDRTPIRSLNSNVSSTAEVSLVSAPRPRATFTEVAPRTPAGATQRASVVDTTDAYADAPDPNLHAVTPETKPLPDTVTIVPPATEPLDGTTEVTAPTPTYSTCTPLRLISPFLLSAISTTRMPAPRAGNTQVTEPVVELVPATVDQASVVADGPTPQNALVPSMPRPCTTTLTPPAMGMVVDTMEVTLPRITVVTESPEAVKSTPFADISTETLPVAPATDTHSSTPSSTVLAETMMRPSKIQKAPLVIGPVLVTTLTGVPPVEATTLGDTSASSGVVSNEKVCPDWLTTASVSCVPRDAAMETLPRAPAGATQCASEEDTTFAIEAEMDPNLHVVNPVTKPEPVIVTTVPVFPEAGNTALTAATSAYRSCTPLWLISPPLLRAISITRIPAPRAGTGQFTAPDVVTVPGVVAQVSEEVEAPKPQTTVFRATRPLPVNMTEEPP